MNIEHVIFSNLVFNEKFVRRTIPYLKDEYFHSESEKVLFSIINDYIQRYNKPPTPETLRLDLDAKRLNEKVYEGISKSISALEVNEAIDLEYLVNQAERFCKDRAIANALRLSINIVDGAKRNLIGVSFHKYLPKPSPFLSIRRSVMTISMIGKSDMTPIIVSRIKFPLTWIYSIKSRMEALNRRP